MTHEEEGGKKLWQAYKGVTKGWNTHARTRFTFCCSTGMHLLYLNRDQPSVAVMQLQFMSAFPLWFSSPNNSCFPTTGMKPLHPPWLCRSLVLEKVIRPQTGWISKISITAWSISSLTALPEAKPNNIRLIRCANYMLDNVTAQNKGAKRAGKPFCKWVFYRLFPKN